MTNREYAAKLQLPLTGNARIPRHGEPPQIYMRNTAFLPGNDTLADMIASVDDGYYLVDGKDPAGDPSGDFACRITEGYRIRNGVLCEPIHDYVVWGCGVDFLTSISMVGDDFEWFTDTFPDRPLAPQAFGAPSIKARLNIEPW
jgi:TldD protein